MAERHGEQTNGYNGAKAFDRTSVPLTILVMTNEIFNLCISVYNVIKLGTWRLFQCKSDTNEHFDRSVRNTSGPLLYRLSHLILWILYELHISIRLKSVLFLYSYFVLNEQSYEALAIR